MKSDFCKKLCLATGLANQMVDTLASSSVPSKVWKCSCCCGSDYAADTLHPLQAKQLLYWEFCITLTAPA